MTYFEKSGTITPDKDKTNIIFEFDLEKETESLTVEYSYTPKIVVDKEKAMLSIYNAMKKYGVAFAERESFLPVSNLITLSFDDPLGYRGACHRQPNEQTIIISDKNSTPGILNRKNQKGKWRVMMNIHFIGCDVDYLVKVKD